MKKSTLAKSEIRFLATIGLLVALLGVPVLLSLDPSKTEAPASLHKPMDGERTPASVEPSAATKTSAKTSVLMIDCDQELMALQQVSSEYVRISGAHCPDNREFEIRNLTNGFSASVIFSKGSRFTTDFIDLREGANELQLRSKLADGSFQTKTMKINRRLPANFVR